MGQAISRRVVRGLEHGRERAERQMEDQIRKDVAAKQRLAHERGILYTDPNALQGGFTRGQEGVSYLFPSEIQQEAFLKQQQMEKAGGEHLELKPDLLQFLERMGPLQKVVDPEFTSPRLMEHWKQQQQQQINSTSTSTSTTTATTKNSNNNPLLDRNIMDSIPNNSRADDRRTLQEMPLMSNSDVTVTRSTNFSKTIYSEDGSNVALLSKEDEYKLGVTDLQWYKLLKAQHDQLKQQQQQQNTTTTTKLSSQATTTTPVRRSPADIVAESMVKATTSANYLPLIQHELVSGFAKQYYQDQKEKQIKLQQQQQTRKTPTKKNNAKVANDNDDDIVMEDDNDDDEIEDDNNNDEEEEEDEATKLRRMQVQEEQATLLRTALSVIDLPIFMKDADGCYFGVYADRVNDLQITSQLQSVPDYKIKLVLADLVDTETQFDKHQQQLKQKQLEQNQAPVKFSTRRRQQQRPKLVFEE